MAARVARRCRGSTGGAFVGSRLWLASDASDDGIGNLVSRPVVGHAGEYPDQRPGHCTGHPGRAVAWRAAVISGDAGAAAGKLVCTTVPQCTGADPDLFCYLRVPV